MFFCILQPRQNLLSAAGRIGEASHDIMKQVGDEDDVDKAFQVNDYNFIVRERTLFVLKFYVVDAKIMIKCHGFSKEYLPL